VWYARLTIKVVSAYIRLTSCDWSVGQFPPPPRDTGSQPWQAPPPRALVRAASRPTGSSAGSTTLMRPPRSAARPSPRPSSAPAGLWQRRQAGVAGAVPRPRAAVPACGVTMAVVGAVPWHLHKRHAPARILTPPSATVLRHTAPSPSRVRGRPRSTTTRCSSTPNCSSVPHVYRRPWWPDCGTDPARRLGLNADRSVHRRSLSRLFPNLLDMHDLWSTAPSTCVAVLSGAKPNKPCNQTTPKSSYPHSC
jgi:hypothetical protein